MQLQLEIDDELLDSYEEAFGADKVAIHNVEEAGEFIQEVAKLMRGQHRPKKLAEEMADLLICMMHLMRLTDSTQLVYTMFREKQGKAVAQIGKENDRGT